MTSESAVEVSELSVKFGDFFAVNDISFKVGRGEIFGFLGANGAGKTTTIRVLCGLLMPSHGEVHVAGHSIYEDEKKIKSAVGYMSQKFTLYNDLTVAENLDFIASLRKLPRSKYLKRRQELLEFISFDRPMDSVVSALPPGTKQHVSLAASLLHDPEIIFLDEPTAGVSPASRALFWSLIQKLAKAKKAVFVTTHYMDEAEHCERIALMREGKIIALDSPQRLKETTFRMKVYEFDPIEPIGFDRISEISKDPIFSFFEPYGLRFHACLRDEARLGQVMASLGKEFTIREIKPTLEDVFIRCVEGENT